MHLPLLDETPKLVSIAKADCECGEIWGFGAWQGFVLRGIWGFGGDRGVFLLPVTSNGRDRNGTF